MKKSKTLIFLILLLGLVFAQKPTTRTPESTDYVRVLDSDGMTWDQTLNQVFGASLGSTFDDITVDNAVIDSIDVDSIDVEWIDAAVIAGSGDFTLDDGTIDTLTVDYITDVTTDDITADSITVSGVANIDTLTVSSFATITGLVDVGTFLNLSAVSEATITSEDSLAVNGTWMVIDTEGDAVLDTVSTITGGVAGHLIIIHTADDGRDVFIDDGENNIQLGGDRTLNDTDDTIILIFDGSNWLELSYTDNS